MIWIIISIALYLLTCGIALFLICSGDKVRGKDAYFDVRHIAVALAWPVILGGHGVWMAGSRLFKDKKQHDGHPPLPIPEPEPRPK